VLPDFLLSAKSADKCIQNREEHSKRTPIANLERTEDTRIEDTNSLAKLNICRIFQTVIHFTTQILF